MDQINMDQISMAEVLDMEMQEAVAPADGFLRAWPLALVEQTTAAVYKANERIAGGKVKDRAKEVAALRQQVLDYYSPPEADEKDGKKEGE